jgi:hypothetical protein
LYCPLCLHNVWICHLGLHIVVSVIRKHMSLILCAWWKTKIPVFDGKSVPQWQPCRYNDRGNGDLRSLPGLCSAPSTNLYHYAMVFCHFSTPLNDIEHWWHMQQLQTKLGRSSILSVMYHTVFPNLFCSLDINIVYILSASSHT